MVRLGESFIILNDKKMAKNERNKTLETIGVIERAIANQADSFCMDDDNDRAQMAVWIYNNFCVGDYRLNLKIEHVE